MKYLYLVRHSKSDWENPDLSDIERHLNERGYAEANKISRRFEDKLDLIISSPAIRAMSTALIFARVLEYHYDNINIKTELYESTTQDYLNVIQSIDKSVDKVMLFGHNPVISHLAQLFTQALPAEMPTSCIVGIKFNINHWNDAQEGELFLMDYPKK